MDKISVKISNLSKCYRIGIKERGYRTFREAIVDSVMAPVRNFKKLNRLTKFNDIKSNGQSRKNSSSSDVIWALKDVSFKVKEGEVLGVIGKNGAGKSTLLKILSRITEPTDGIARIKGMVSSLLEVGTGFHPELTGRDNIFLNGAVLGMRRREIEKNFDKIVDFSGVSKFLDTPVKRYSSGMYVRLAFAVAAQLAPEVLLVDEVLAVGDMPFQKKCLGKMEEVAKGGRTVLFVSHNMTSIINLCQRVILLDRGRVIKDGKPSDVVEHYLETALSFGGEVVWSDMYKAPGDNTARLHAVRIMQDDSITAQTDISKDMFIQIEYWCLEEGALLYTALLLKDRMLYPVFASGNATSVSLTDDPWYGRPHPVGLFKSICRIPGNFLNDGLYNITAIIGRLPNFTLLFENDVLSFQVQDTGSMRKHGVYSGWAGVVRPQLAWKTEYVGSKSKAATEV